jgi:hypothetical protein
MWTVEIYKQGILIDIPPLNLSNKIQVKGNGMIWNWVEKRNRTASESVPNNNFDEYCCNELTPVLVTSVRHLQVNYYIFIRNEIQNFGKSNNACIFCAKY